jgi:hypothetical protein
VLPPEKECIYFINHCENLKSLIMFVTCCTFKIFSNCGNRRILHNKMGSPAKSRTDGEYGDAHDNKLICR